MADTEKNLEALEAEAVAEATAADAPKKNAVAAEPSKLSNEAEDLGPAVVKNTDSNPDATKKVKEVSNTKMDHLLTFLYGHFYFFQSKFITID